MKKLLFIFGALLLITSCDSEQDSAPEPEIISVVKDSIQVYEGNFIMAGDAAVFKGNKFVYEVKMDSTAMEFKDSLKSYKASENGIVPVKLKGKVTKNFSASSYSQLLTITEVVEINAERSENTESEKNNVD